MRRIMTPCDSNQPLARALFHRAADLGADGQAGRGRRINIQAGLDQRDGMVVSKIMKTIRRSLRATSFMPRTSV
jgi:hypothetical protein